MKVAMISEHASPLATVDGLGGADGGGQNVFVADLAGQLGRLGHQVTVFTRRDAPDLPGRVEFAPGVTVEHVPAGPARPLPKDRLPRWMPDFGGHLARQWASDPPDLAHAHFWMSGLAALQAAAPYDIPVVQTYHALGTVKRRHQGDRDTSPPQRIRLERAIGRTADAVIATCADEVAELTRMGVPRDRIAVVPCGVDLDLFRPEGPAEPAGAAPRLVVLSRLVERKGVDTAIESLAQIPDAELLVAGGPPAAELAADPEVHRLRLCAKEAGVADRVGFVGRVSRADVPALLRSADLAVTLPWYEPFGMVPLEAMACGVPVIATAVGGHLDTVVHQVTGVRVRPRRPGEAARRIRDLLAEPARRRAFGIAAVDRARSRFSWERVARETVRVYERVIK
jgi:glycosyltransferase involved in cell wall biosynthesis